MNFFDKLYKKYLAEMQNLDYVSPMSQQEFEEYVNSFKEHLNSVQIDDKGILYYFRWEEDGSSFCTVPSYGYYADDEKTLSKLFEKLTAQFIPNDKVVFYVEQYAHDYESQRLWSMLQFGMLSEKCVRKIDTTIVEDASIHELSKKEIEDKWSELWTLTNAIVNHLKSSPVFYPGTEFTEDVYREFYMDDDTRVYGAFDENDKLIGIIETNAESNPFVFGNKTSINVGEAYVLPEYRGTGLSKRLLYYAESHSGASYSWVEHGTANPNARGFWNKYYNTYQYEMTRSVTIL